MIPWIAQLGTLNMVFIIFILHLWVDFKSGKYFPLNPQRKKEGNFSFQIGKQDKVLRNKKEGTVEVSRKKKSEKVVGILLENKNICIEKMLFE